VVKTKTKKKGSGVNLSTKPKYRITKMERRNSDGHLRLGHSRTDSHILYVIMKLLIHFFIMRIVSIGRIFESKTLFQG